MTPQQSNDSFTGSRNADNIFSTLPWGGGRSYFFLGSRSCLFFQAWTRPIVPDLQKTDFSLWPQNCCLSSTCACARLCTRTPAARHAATHRRPTDLLPSQVCVFAAVVSRHNRSIKLTLPASPRDSRQDAAEITFFSRFRKGLKGN